MARASSLPPTPDPSMRMVVLHGEERFLAEEWTHQFAQTLEAHFGGLQTFSFDGETAAPADVLDELRSYGLLQQHKLIIVDQADVFLAGGKRSGDDEEEVDEESSPKHAARRLLEKYAENPLDDSTLLLRAATWRKGKIDKHIGKHGGVYQCEPLNETSAAEWCIKRARDLYESKLNKDAARLLVSQLGSSLHRLDVEIAKLAAFADAGETISAEHVRSMVGLSGDEKAWVIQDAMATGDARVMIERLRELWDVSLQDMVPLTWAVMDFMRKLHAAGQMTRENHPPGSIKSKLRLWGSSADRIVNHARRLSSARSAQLLQDAVNTDLKNKTGVGDPRRSLEALLVRIADTIGRS